MGKKTTWTHFASINDLSYEVEKDKEASSKKLQKMNKMIKNVKPVGTISQAKEK